MASSVGDGEFGFQIAPMLDILFVLLLFFMVSAGAQKHEASLTTQLPGQGPAGTSPVQIGIDADGQVTWYDSPIDTPIDHNLPHLVSQLHDMMATNPKQPVIITPTRSTRHQRVIDVLNACHVAKVQNLAFGSPQD
ncbi:MAG: biopolymer transporter ExbD [Methylacidiphilales bacterium]|nr:biopolymer transporter ExbD [Candidatus Methylacidiphilales bacterium]